MITAASRPPAESLSARIAMLAFRGYKRVLGPVLHATAPAGSGCGFHPSCSEYALVAISWHGPLRGGALALWRVLRCNPWNRGGLDPVPPRKDAPPM
jgi:uncharacterized protein